MQLRMVAIAGIAAGMILTFVTSVSAASWSPAVRIATSDAEITPQVKLLADGRTALGLRRAYLGFGVSIARPRAPFSAPTWIRLTPDRTGSARLPFLHRTALARDGTAVVLFAAHLRVTRERRIVFRPGQAQAVPRSISSDGHSVGAWDSSADLAIASDGTGVAAWARYTGSRWQVEVATMDHHGDFAATVAIDAPDPFVSDITVAAAPGHNALVVWRSLPSDSDDAFFFEGHLDGVAVTDGVVGERLNISGRQPYLSDLQAAVGRDGTGVVSWTERPGGLSETLLHLATLTPNGTLERTIVAHMPPAPGYGPPAITVDATGAVTVAWISPQDSRDPLATDQVMTATSTHGGALSAPQIVSRPDEFPSDLTLAARDDGAALLAWVRHSTGGQGLAIAAATRLPGENFGQPSDVDNSPPDTGGNAPAADIAPDGRLALAWQEGYRKRILLVTGSLK